MKHQRLVLAPTTPDQFNAFIRGEMDRNAKIIRTLNVRVE
jgi:hypothetical protein